MTVSSTTMKNITISNGGTDNFPFEFPITDLSDVKVYFYIAGLDVLQTAYTVDSIDYTQGGNVIFDTVPATDTKITIVREIGLTQDTNYVENDPFPAEAHEGALDKLTMIAQQMDEIQDRCLRYPISDIIQMSADLPDLESRKNKFIYFNQDGVLQPAEGQLIQSTHTHTELPNLEVLGVLGVGDSLYTPYLEIVGSAYIENLELSGPFMVTGAMTFDGDITHQGNFGTTGDISCVDITATSGTFTSIITGTATVTTLNCSNISIGENFDVPGYITLGENDGLKLSSTGYNAVLYAQAAGVSEVASIILQAEESDDLGGGPFVYLQTGYDALYEHKVDMEESFVFGKNFRATDIDYTYPTFYSDAKNIVAAGNGMEFHILSLGRDAEDTDPYGFTWHTGDYTMTSGTTPMTLTESGILTVASGIYVGAIEVSMEGHIHDDRYYTETEIDNLNLLKLNVSGGTISGSLTITGDLTVSGTTITVDTETVLIEDNLLVINNNEVGAGVSAGVAGIEVERGSEINYLFYFDEGQDNFRVGVSGSLQAVATREDIPTVSGVAIWNDALYRFDTVIQSTAFNKDFGTTSGTVCDGADSRLSDARTPTSHNHDDLYYTENEVDTISGSLYDEIVLASGILQDQIDLLPTDLDLTTLSGALHDEIVLVSGVLQDQITDTPQVEAIYFGGPTTSGTFKMEVVGGNLEVQWYNGITWFTKTTWSGGE